MRHSVRLRKASSASSAPNINLLQKEAFVEKKNILHVLLLPPSSWMFIETKRLPLTFVLFPSAWYRGLAAMWSISTRLWTRMLAEQPINWCTWCTMLDNLAVLVNSYMIAIIANQPSVQRSGSQARTHIVTLCRVLFTVGNLTPYPPVSSGSAAALFFHSRRWSVDSGELGDLLKPSPFIHRWEKKVNKIHDFCMGLRTIRKCRKDN